MPLPRPAVVLGAVLLSLAAACGGGDEGPPASAAGEVELFGDGVDLPNRVVSFGDPLEQVEEVIVGALGEPTLDTGVIEPFSAYGTCPGEALRVLEFSGGALLLLFGDGEQPGGPLALFAWQLTEDGSPASAPQARALMGDVSTYEFGVGVSVPELQEGLGEAVRFFAEEGPFPPGFRVEDQSAGLFGAVTGTGEDGVVTVVAGGSQCGE